MIEQKMTICTHPIRVMGCELLDNVRIFPAEAGPKGDRRGAPRSPRPRGSVRGSCGCLLQSVAAEGVSNGERKEPETKRQQHEIEHLKCSQANPAQGSRSGCMARRLPRGGIATAKLDGELRDSCAGAHRKSRWRQRLWHKDRI